MIWKGAAVGSLAGQLAERGVNHFIEDREVRSDLGSLADIADNPARELVKTAGVTFLDGALGALGGKMDAGADKVIMATANKKMSRTLAKGSATAVKKAVKSGLKIAGKRATEALAEKAGNLAENDRKNVFPMIKDISRLPVRVARQKTEKVPTLKFLASQIPRRLRLSKEEEQPCFDFGEISTALKELEEVEVEEEGVEVEVREVGRQPTEPNRSNGLSIKYLASHIPRSRASGVENEEELVDHPKELEFSASSQIPQVQQDVIEDLVKMLD